VRGSSESAGRLLDASGYWSRVGAQPSTHASGEMVRAANGRWPALRAAPVGRRPMGIARA
jgi:hypothetical protein